MILMSNLHDATAFDVLLVGSIKKNKKPFGDGLFWPRSKVRSPGCGCRFLWATSNTFLVGWLTRVVETTSYQGDLSGVVQSLVGRKLCKWRWVSSFAFDKYNSPVPSSVLTTTQLPATRQCGIVRPLQSELRSFGDIFTFRRGKLRHFPPVSVRWCLKAAFLPLQFSWSVGP